MLLKIIVKKWLNCDLSNVTQPVAELHEIGVQVAARDFDLVVVFLGADADPRYRLLVPDSIVKKQKFNYFFYYQNDKIIFLLFKKIEIKKFFQTF